jgi:hypothetical protein
MFWKHALDLQKQAFFVAVLKLACLPVRFAHLLNQLPARLARVVLEQSGQRCFPARSA